MTSKQAACLNCRKSKIKCKRAPGAPICDRCENIGTECVIPSFHVGRQKGVKNKRKGLDKAIHQIEEAIKKSKPDILSNEAILQSLQLLLDEARGSASESARNPSPFSAQGCLARADQDGPHLVSDDHLSLDDAENPLQLLARASDLRLSMAQPAGPSASIPSSGHMLDDLNGTLDVHRFFSPIKVRLDQGPELDPIDIGLVSLEEASMLVSFFHEKLAHTRWGLDPFVHTLDFVRGQSAFLLTSLLLASARFMPSASALAKRLLIHRKYLVEQVIAKRFRSVEIVLAFMVNIPWMHPLEQAADDDTGVFISIALSIALDLSLNKIITPSQSFGPDLHKKIPKADCIEAKKALAMDGFEEIDTQSLWAQRLLRRRERAWIALFVLERGVCLARGRSYCLPITPLVTYCDTWHAHAISDQQDGSLVSMAVLRRDLDQLFTAVRSRCDRYTQIDVGSKVAQDIEAMVDEFFSNWLAKWTAAIGEGGENTLPPYVEILLTHTRLSTYSGVINHPTAPIEVKRQFRASALSSALNVMRAAIQGESRLMSMPNNTVIMICFAACVALNLSTPIRGGDHDLTPSVRHLIEETATVLERIGSTPSHRNGASVLYGRYLRELVKHALAPRKPPEPSAIQDLSRNPMSYTPVPSAPVRTEALPPSFGQASYPIVNSWEQPFQFSTMSSNEVTETIMNSGHLDSSLFDLPLDDHTFSWFDWMNPPEFGF